MQRKRKIAFLVTESWYFLSHRLPIAQAARGLGWEVVVITRQDGQAPIVEDGLRVVELALKRAGRHPLQEMASLWDLYRILEREKPDILHAVGLKPVLYGATLARLCGIHHVIGALGGMGYIFTSASLRIRVIRRFIIEWLRLALRWPGARLIVQNADDAQMMIKGGVVASNQVDLIRGSGVDLNFFQPLPEPLGETVVFAVVCRMLADKGVREVVLAARELRRMGSPAVVWLVGPPDPGNPTSLTERQLKAWHDEGCIQWKGAVNDVRDIWAQAHVCVLPSYREGLPKALLEAAACGRPIITTDVPGCREVVRDGVDGVLVPATDWLALAAAMDQLARSGELRHRMGSAARCQAEECFGINHVVSETVGVYRKALATE